MPSAIPPAARRRRLGAILGFLLLTVTLAAASRASATVTSQTITGSATPSAQQPVTRGPVELSIGIDTTYDTPATPSPTLTEWEYYAEDDFLFSTAGLTECPGSNPTSSQTTSQAITACGTNSVVGSGTATFTGAAPCASGCSAMVTVFNTPFSGMQFAAIAMHMYIAATNTAAVARLGMVSLTMGDFTGGTRFRMSGSGLPVAPGIALTELDVTLGNRPEAHDDNYVTARCGDNDDTWNFGGHFVFGTAATIDSTDTAPCQPVGNTLTAAIDGTGTGTVTSTPAGISCPGDCAHTYETTPGPVALIAVPGSGSTFDGWNTCPGTVTTTTITDDTCTVTVDADKTATAQFAAQPNARTLDVTVGGAGFGTVTSAPSGITCPADCSDLFANGASATLTASPEAGSTFAGWSTCPGTVSTTTITNDTCTVTMDANKSATASFELQRLLTVSKTGSGFGTVTSAPSGISCGADCSENFNENSMVTLTAMPVGGSTFTGWTGSGCSGTGTCQITMDAAKSVSAGFAAGPSAFVVDTLADGADAAPDGVCATSGMACTLKAAVQEANATAVADTITFSVTGEHVVTGLFPLLSITTPMTITGNGSAPGGTALDGNDTNQVINVGTTAGQVTLRDLRIQDGRSNFAVGMPPTASGGGIQVIGTQMGTPPSLTLDGVTVTGNDVVSNGAGGVALGGGIFAGFDVDLTLIESTVSGNTASGTDKGSGAGIYTTGDVSVTESTVSGNQILGGSTRTGGGIAAAGVFTVASIVNSTISGNGATMGGGLYQGGSSSTISASTLAANTASGGGADFYSASGTAIAKSSIFASPNACALESTTATLTSAGRNLDNGASCGFGISNGNLQNSNPMLVSLTNNGGPTETHALMPGSPAIDAGSAVDGVTTDQRGTPRPQGAGCDIGAFEAMSALGASCVATTVPVTPDPSPGGSGGGGGDTPVSPKKCKKGQKLKKGKCVKKRKKK